MTDFSPLDSALYESTPEKIAASLRYLRKADAVMAALMPLSASTPAPPAAPNAWEPSGKDYDRSIHSNPDAKAWADLFVDTFPGLADKRDLMLGWFANAMMAMHDSIKQKQAPPAAVPPERDWTMIQCGDTSIPAWVVHYANAIGAYMKGQNVQHWAVGPIQSRNEAPPAAVAAIDKARKA